MRRADAEARVERVGRAGVGQRQQRAAGAAGVERLAAEAAARFRRQALLRGVDGGVDAGFRQRVRVAQHPSRDADAADHRNVAGLDAGLGGSATAEGPVVVAAGALLQVHFGPHQRHVGHHDLAAQQAQQADREVGRVQREHARARRPRRVVEAHVMHLHAHRPAEVDIEVAADDEGAGRLRSLTRRSTAPLNQFQSHTSIRTSRAASTAPATSQPRGSRRARGAAFRVFRWWPSSAMRHLLPSVTGPALRAAARASRPRRGMSLRTAEEVGAGGPGAANENGALRRR